MTDTVKIQQDFKQSYAELLAEYGSHSAIPRQKVDFIGEVMRARYVLLEDPAGDPIRLLKQYMVAESVITYLTGTDASQMLVRKEKRADKYAKMVAWAEANAGATTTVYELAEIGDVSYPTANKLVKDRPDLFHRVKKGSYLVRDPKAERAADKGGN